MNATSTATSLEPAPAQSVSLRLLALAALSLAGLGISGYLTYVRLAHAVPMCSTVRGCETVNSSPYAAIGEIPIALLGMGLYTLLLCLSLVAWKGPTALQPWAVLGSFGLALSGTLYSGYLTYIEVFVLQALCQWCLTSATVVTTMCGLSAWTLLRPPGALPG